MWILDNNYLDAAYNTSREELYSLCHNMALRGTEPNSKSKSVSVILKSFRRQETKFQGYVCVSAISRLLAVLQNGLLLSHCCCCCCEGEGGRGSGEWGRWFGGEGRKVVTRKLLSSDTHWLPSMGNLCGFLSLC